MSMLDAVLVAFCLLTLGLHLGTAAVAIRRCRPSAAAEPVMQGTPAVSILRPVCGVDTYDHITLRSTFELDYPDARLIFCCDQAHDPAARLVRALIAEYPHRNAKLLIGRDPLTSNPKLNNLIKGWPHVDADWLILADSNVLMPKDYVQRLLSAWGPRTGILCAPPIGDRPAGFWGELECAFLNTYQARWQYAADSAGFGFAQGKTMTFRRRDLAAAGGMIALGAEVAEDAAATKVVRALGLRAQLVDAPFKQPLGPRTVRQVWDRQARWSRLRRMTFPALFLPEILTTSLFSMAAAAYLADSFDLPALAGAMALAAVWYGAEAVLALCAGWQLSWWSPLAYVTRDVMLPALWAQGWVLDSFSWRGNSVSADGPASQTA